MQNSEISTRYAKALFQLATETDSRKEVLADLRSFQHLFAKENLIKNYFTSNISSIEEKKKLLSELFKKTKVSKEVQNFIYLLADKRRFALFESIVVAYQKTSDDVYGVTRGQVKSSKPLSESEQTVIEAKISEVTGKKVILNYECDPSIIGGLYAEVGGYVFDDTIVTHLKRLKDDIKRRTH